MRKVFLVLAALILAGLAWNLVRRSPQAPPAAGPVADREATAPTSPLAGTAGEAQDETSPNPAASRQEVDPSQSVVTILGRTVDDDTGEPLPACVLRVHGYGPSPTRRAAYVAEHGELSWTPPESQTTEEDGRFSFTFVPPPPYGYELRAGRKPFLSIETQWTELKPGTVVDLGDVPLSRGIELSGRVVDTNGVPQDNVRVELHEVDPAPGEGLQPSYHPVGTSEADGTLVSGTLWPDSPFSIDPVIRAWPGTWSVQVSRAQLVGPEEVVLAAGTTRSTLEVVVKSSAEMETITGIVVDDTGAPVSGASLLFMGDPMSSARSNQDGTFRLERGSEQSEEARIRATRLYHDELVTEDMHWWGESDLRLVLRRGLEVAVLALDAETGDPIEDYGMRNRLDPDATTSSTRSTSLREAGHHEGGRALVSGILRGVNLLMVEPSDEEYSRSQVVRFEMTDQGAPRQVVRISRNVIGTLFVQDSSGDPLSGVTVELIRPKVGEPVGLDTQTLRITSALWADIAFRLQTTETDREGRVELTAPAGEPLSLRISGLGRQPLVVHDFVLEPGAETRITMPVGAAVSFTASPLQTLQEWAPDASLLGGVPRQTSTPGIYLTRKGTGDGFPPRLSSVPFSEDGEVTVTGIPPGTWNYSLEYSVIQPNGRQSRDGIHFGELADLREGEGRSVTVDLRELSKSTLSVRALLDGEPFANATVQAQGSKPDGTVRLLAADAVTDDLGFASFRLPPGTYQLQTRYPIEGTGEEAALLFSEPVVMESGRDLDRVLSLRLTTVRLEVHGSDGEPVKGIRLHGMTPGSDRPHVTPRTDANGFTRFLQVPLEVLEVRGYPRALRTSRARADHERDHGSVPFLELATIDLRTLEHGVRVRITLPPESGY